MGLFLACFFWFLKFLRIGRLPVDDKTPPFQLYYFAQYSHPPDTYPIRYDEPVTFYNDHINWELVSQFQFQSIFNRLGASML